MKKIKNKNFKAFTLVELIIVITILAILATIAFMSYQGYTSQTRDSNRLSVIKQLEKGLDIHQIKAGKYPTPDNLSGTGIISGENILFLGNVGENISRIIQINKIPTDPLTQNKYVYGTDANFIYYQVATTFENEVAYNNPLFPTTYANNYYAKVSGNYIGLLKTSTKLCNIPSLIFTGSGDLVSTDTYFVVDKSSNLPYQPNSDTLYQIQNTQEILSLIGSSTGAIICQDMTNFTTNSTSISQALGYNLDIIGKAYYGDKYFTEIKATLPIEGGGGGGGGGTYPPESERTPANYFTFDSGTKTITAYDYDTGPKNVVIPATIGGVAVEKIGQRVFSRYDLTSVKIPPSVIDIGGETFDHNLLTSVLNYDGFESNEYIYASDGNGGVKINLYFGTSKTPVIPSTINGKTVTSIGRKAFREMWLTSVTIPNTIKTIGGWAFWDNSITSVIIPDSVTTLENDAFHGAGLENLTIGNGITSIGFYVFDSNKLTSVIIPSSVTSIGWNAFSRNKLTSVTIPLSVTSIGGSAFGSQINSLGGGTVYGPSGGYVQNTYIANTNTAFDKTKLTNYVVQ